MKHCETCRFWGAPIKEEGETRGICLKIKTLGRKDEESLAGIELDGFLLPSWKIRADGQAQFTPCAKFYCILHKERDSANREKQ